MLGGAFRFVSRLLLLSVIILALRASPVFASTISCAEEEGGWDCSLVVDSVDGVEISFTLSVASDVVFTSFTSLTCDDHGSDESTGAYAADPYLYLYNDSDVLLILLMVLRFRLRCLWLVMWFLLLLRL